MTQHSHANAICWLFGHDLVSVQTQRGKSRSGCLRCGKLWVYDHPRASWLEFRSDWKGNAAYAAGRMSRDKKIATLKELNERQREALERLGEAAGPLEAS